MEEMSNPIAQQLDAKVAQAAQDANNGIGSISPEMKKKLLTCIVGMKEQYPENKFLFSIDDTPVISQADVHTIGAKQKAGKTSLITIMISAILCGLWNRVKCLEEDMSVLYIDTEMKMVDTQQLGFKAAEMSGTDIDTLTERVHLVNFRPLTPAEMEEGIRYFVSLYKPKLVFVDGVVDLCANFNDVEASQNLVLNFLMKLAEHEQCAIINVLHTNKSDGYTELRGHLGAFFEQKGATVIKCEKDEKSNIVTVSFPTHRYAPVPEFHFTFNEKGIPVSADAQYQEIEDAKQLSKEEQKAAEKEAIYGERSKVITSIILENGGSMERKALIEAAMARIGKGRSTIKNLITQMKEGNDAPIIENNSVITLNSF